MNSEPVKTSTETASSAEWFGHPRPLARLFTTEMWERFGYYGMRALLTLYLADHFLFRDPVINGLYGAFAALVYLTPFFGGMMADRYLGYKKSVKVGAILLSLGYFCLCLGGEKAEPIMRYGGQEYKVETVKAKSAGEKDRQFVVTDAGKYEIQGNSDGSIILKGAGDGALPAKMEQGAYKFDGTRDDFYLAILFFAFAALAIGNGFFKPNISTMVGALYDQTDPRRSSGFSIFYMGINLGSMISQILCPVIAAAFGWSWGFALAGAGMFVSYLLVQFDGGQLDAYGAPPKLEKDPTLWVVLGSLTLVPLIWFLMYNTMMDSEASTEAARAGAGVIAYLVSLPILGKVLGIMFLGSIIGTPIYAWFTGTKEEYHKMVVAAVLITFSVVFWTLFEQAGTSMTLYADRNTDRELTGIIGSVYGFIFGTMTMPAGQVQFFNPLFIVILAPLFAIMWGALSRIGFEPSTPVKFAVGLILVGVGFMALVYGAQFHDGAFRVPLMWLILAYLLHSIAELCLSPVGLAMITNLSMPRIVGMMMGVWFLATAMAQYVAGIVSQFASVETVAGKTANPQLALQTYMGVFETIGIASMIIGAVLFVMSWGLRKWMHDVH